jgi:hypothetical protein
MRSTIEPTMRLLAVFGVLFGVGFGVFQLWKHVGEKYPEALGPSMLLVMTSSFLAATCAFFVFYSRLSLVWLGLVALLGWSGVAWCVTR